MDPVLEVDAVLGMSVTPSAVGLVLVEGQDADGATVDRNTVYPRRRSTPQQIADEAAAAVLRAETLAAARGHRLRSIGVTWSDDADAEATLLLRSLSDCGFDSVVPIRMPEASEALAWGVADVIGHTVTAVCVVESGAVLALIVHTAEGAVQTAVNHTIVSEEGLVRWLGAVFARADWRPEALVLVGSSSGLDALMPRLEDVLGVPVFSPAEAEFALARGAALAAAHSGTPPATSTDVRAFPPPGRRSRQPALTAPLAMLTAGTVTFVASVSAAISLQLAPFRDVTPVEPRPAAKSSPDIAAAAPRPAAPPRAAVAEPAPAVVPPIDEPEAPPIDEVPVEAVDLAPPPELAPEPLAPPVPGGQGFPPEPLPPGALPDGTLAPEALPPGALPADQEPVPQRRGLLQRIRDRLSDLGPDPAPPPVVDPALAPPPDPALAPPPPDPALAAPPPEDAAPPPAEILPPPPDAPLMPPA
ncbi:DUF7159 family protein [Mycolicibacterium phlei]